MSITENRVDSPAGIAGRIGSAVVEHPHDDAIRTATSSMTYAELGRRVDAFAADLVGRTARGEFVAVEGRRCPAALVAMIGCLRTGRPFVVLDPRDADATNAEKTALLHPGVAARCEPGDASPTLGELPARWRPADEAAPVPPVGDPEGLAYAIYTSGSTGRPKCVLVGAGPLTTMIDDHVARLEVTASSRTLQFARLTFDGCITEIFWTLTSGACLVVLDEEHLVPGPVLAQTLRDFAITHFKSTPFALTATEVDPAGALEHVVNGGGAARPSTVAKWATVASFHNAYGTTETTVCNLLTPPLDPGGHEDGVPLGDVLGDCGFEVEEVAAPDGAAPPAPGTRGQLVITGASVAEGYLTADGLVRFGDGEHRRYPTGDLVEVREGRPFFVGRLDRQTKVRGFRLDPGEIEAAVCAHPAVSEAVVLTGAHDGAPDGEGDALLCYYQGDTDSRALREYLEGVLDPYKVPSVITAVDGFSYTPNGKVDPEALRPAAAPEPQDAAPADRMVALVRRLTGVEDAGLEDNFFEIGGDSASAVVLVNRIKEWGWADAGVRDVLRAPTLGALADRLPDREV